MAPAQGRKKQTRMAVGLPVFSEQDERIIWKRNKTVFGAFSTLDMDQHPMGIDVGHFEEKRLLKPEAARIHDGKEDEVVKRFHMAKDVVDFFPAEDAGEALFRLGFQNLEKMPILLQYVDEEEFQGTVTNLERTGRPPGFIPAIEEVGLEVSFGYLAGVFSKMLDEHPDGSGIAFLSTFTHPGQLKSIDGLVVPRGLQALWHDNTPSLKGVDWR
jgi:hypothetical protein